MLNSALNYPYPLLRKLPVDYKSSTFSADLNKYNRKNGFEVKIQYHLNNLQISKMIDDKLLAYAVQIQCVSTWYRKLKISTADTDSVFLPSGLVHERVELCPCIIALKDIQKFDNEDFSDDFDGISFSLNKGEVVAIGEREKFDAYYKKDILKTGDTILHVNQDKKAELMHQEFDSDIIQVYLPENQYKMYTTITIKPLSRKTQKRAHLPQGPFFSFFQLAIAMVDGISPAQPNFINPFNNDFIRFSLSNVFR